MYFNGFSQSKALEATCRFFNFQILTELSCHDCDHVTREEHKASFRQIMTPVPGGQSLKYLIETGFDKTEDITQDCANCGKKNALMLKNQHLYSKYTAASIVSDKPLCMKLYLVTLSDNKTFTFLTG